MLKRTTPTNIVPLNKAALCADCDIIFEVQDGNWQCVKCTSRALLSLSFILSPLTAPPVKIGRSGVKWKDKVELFFQDAVRLSIDDIVAKLELENIWVGSNRRNSIIMALSRLVKEGKIIRAGKGVYVRPPR